MKSLYFYFLLILISFLTGCSQPQSTVKSSNPKYLRIMGSETLMPVTQKLAAEYMQLHPDISVHVLGGGTTTGVKAITEGQAEICAASRPLKPEEVKIIAGKYNSVGLSYMVAKDALSIYVHPLNPVKSLTTEQVRGLFLGEILNWKEVGGNDSPVEVFVRPPNSGTYLYFKEHILFNESQATGTLIVPTSQALATVISKTVNGIGYGGISHMQGVRNLNINGIEPTEENVKNDRYPITRYLFFYVVDTPKDPTEPFINWVQSPAGQKIVQEAGFISLW
ncbi:MAG: phosphate ABC transporter substrate-binding protein [Bacteroidetes bacterium]|nr:phosphate ABC transporter substrate-binding protein [Bacteroidota bacterium]